VRGEWQELSDLRIWEAMVLDIVLEGDPRLRQKATGIKRVDDSVRQLANEMYEMLPSVGGVAVAAPQVGVTRRLIVIRYMANEEDDAADAKEEREITYRLVNPEVIRGHGEQVGLEGCLSIPGWVGEVPRYDAITVKAVDMDNKPVRVKASGYLARVFQHEIDHLDGILFTDRILDRETLRYVGDDDD
jgi:peptide deformylase